MEGVKNGKGRYEWEGRRRVYEGEFRNGYMWGLGRLQCGEGDYTGYFVRNKMVGENVKVKTAYGEYEGPLVDGKMEGFGKFSWFDGKVYTGWFNKGQLDGSGKIKFPNGQVIKGTWREGVNEKISLIISQPPLD